MPQNIRFQERQYFRQWWILLVVLIAALPQWALFIVQIVFRNPAGTNPAPDAMVILFWLVFGIGLPLLFLLFHMDTIVTDQELIIRFAPFVKRQIPLSDIEKVEARQYRPLREYGGWGIRWGWGGKRAYNVKGSQGVEITLSTGKPIMVGTQHPDQLAAALREGK